MCLGTRPKILRHACCVGQQGSLGPAHMKTMSTLVLKLHYPSLCSCRDWMYSQVGWRPTSAQEKNLSCLYHTAELTNSTCLSLKFENSFKWVWTEFMFLNKSVLNSLRSKINICCLWYRVQQGIKGSDPFSTNTRDSKAVTQITVVLYSILNLQRLVIIPSACSRLMIHSGESFTDFTVQLSAYMQWPDSLNNIYINCKLLWKKNK